MSKPTTRAFLVTLLGIVLIAAAYMTVQSVFAKAESTGAQAHLVNGLQTNFNHDRSTVSELNTLQAQNNYADPGAGQHQGGGCHEEMHSVPQD